MALKVHVMGGSAATMRALISNSIDLGIAGGDSVIRANRAGADLVIIAGLVNRFYHRLVVRSKIQTAEDVKGKSIGLPFLGGPQDIAVRFAMGELGLSYDRDIKLLSLGKEFGGVPNLLFSSFTRAVRIHIGWPDARRQCDYR